MNRLVKVWQLGRIGYKSAIKLQKHLVTLHHNSSEVEDTLLLLEHYPVYTTGIRNKQYSIEEEEKLKKKTGAEFYRTDRGGLITFHGPGQLILYPIINLKRYNAGMKWYVCRLEQTVINLCKQLGLDAQTSPHTGVWIGNNKVCAIGIHGSRFITSHGIALNCCTDLSWYDHIVPCGIEDKGVTSLSKELNDHVSIEGMVPLLLNNFSHVFQCNFCDYPVGNKDSIIENLRVEKLQIDQN